MLEDTTYKDLWGDTVEDPPEYIFDFKLGEVVKDIRSGRVGSIVKISGPEFDPDVTIEYADDRSTEELNPRRLVRI